jgi:hypothetical protein
MSLNDLLAMNADWLRDPDCFGKEVTYMDPSTSPATPVPVTGIFEILGIDPLVQLQEGKTVMEQATFEAPATMAIPLNGWFVVGGENWKITGRAGRDDNFQTITCQHPIVVSRRMAQRLGT